MTRTGEGCTEIRKFGRKYAGKRSSRRPRSAISAKTTRSVYTLAKMLENADSEAGRECWRLNPLRGSTHATTVPLLPRGA